MTIVMQSCIEYFTFYKLWYNAKLPEVDGLYEGGAVVVDVGTGNGSGLLGTG